MKNKPAIILLLLANAVSGFAQGISITAIGWYIVDIMDQAQTYNLLFLTVSSISIFWNPVGGAIIDKLSRKHIFLGLNILGMLILGSSALAFPEDLESGSWLLYAVFTFTVLNFNIHYPALYAFVQEMSEKKDYGRINSMLEIQGQTTRMISGAFAAILLSGLNQGFIDKYNLPFQIDFTIAPWPIEDIFLMDAITYALAFMLILAIRYVPISVRKKSKAPFLIQLKDGASFLKNNTILFYFGICSYAIFVTLIVHNYFLTYSYVSQYLNEGADVLASVQILYTLGALISGIWIRRLFRKMDSVRAIVIMMFITIVILLGAASFKNVGLYLLISFIYGITNSGTRILRITYLFNIIPNDIIGRSTSVFNVANIVGRVILLLLFNLPFLAGNTSYPYLIMAGTILLCSIPLLVHYKKLSVLKQEDLSVN